MPFDGTLYQRPINPLNFDPQPKRHVTISRGLLVIKAILVLVIVCILALVSEAAYPDRGPITYLFNGASTVHQNSIGWNIIEHSKRLKFYVGSVPYTVLAPDHHPLTAEEQTAWLGFIKFKGYPAYPVDGPMVIDP